MEEYFTDMGKSLLLLLAQMIMNTITLFRKGYTSHHGRPAYFMSIEYC